MWMSHETPNVEENLPLQNAVLKASPSGWCVFYYRAGPDRRYNNANVWVQDAQVVEHARDWLRAWDAWEAVRGRYSQGSAYAERIGALTVTDSGSFEYGGETVYNGGICVSNPYPAHYVKTKPGLMAVIEMLEYVTKRGPELVADLKRRAQASTEVADPFSILHRPTDDQ